MRIGIVTEGACTKSEKKKAVRIAPDGLVHFNSR
jgi:hypothetical protein